MKDKKRTEILLKVIEKVCMKNPETQKLIDKSIINKEEDCHPNRYFFSLLAVELIVMDYLNINVLYVKDGL